jgi:hypothetical protein
MISSIPVLVFALEVSVSSSNDLLVHVGDVYGGCSNQVEEPAWMNTPVPIKPLVVFLDRNRPGSFVL